MQKKLKRANFYAVGVFVLLTLVTWMARFSSSKHFGLYYEDWGRIPIAMSWTWSDWLEYIAEVPDWIINFEYEGRPLHVAGIHTFAFIGQQLGGLPAIYLIGYGIAALNTLLYYFLLKRISERPLFALLGALAFALFPADTSQALLTITLGILPALTLVLVAFHLYLNGNRLPVLASYALSFISVLYYEKFLLLFCVAPLLKKEWNRESWKEWGRHSGIVFIILGVVAIGRKITGENRVSNLEWSSFFNPLFSMVVGPVVAMNAFLERPFQSLTSIQIEWWIPLGIVFLAIASVIYQSLSCKSTPQIEQLRDRNLGAKPNSPAILADTFQLNSSYRSHLLRLAIAGLLMLILAYALNFLDSPYIVEGRTSFVHVAAVVGASLLWACGCSLIFSLSVFAHKKMWVAMLASAYFTSLIAFGLLIQQDYVFAAQYQRSFWTQLVKLCPDMTAGTVILVEPSVSKEANNIEPIQPLRSGHFARVLGYIYRFPNAWVQKGEVWKTSFKKFKDKFKRSKQPKIYQLNKDWKTTIVSEEGTMLFDLSRQTVEPGKFAGLKVRSSNVILIGGKAGQLVRDPGPLILKGQSFPLKQNDSSLELPPFQQGVLYPYLIADQVNQIQHRD
jgi:drug/metabolite transporter superfamily protein YnfA